MKINTKKQDEISKADILSAYDYDPNVGVFIRKRTGKAAGKNKAGYCILSLCRRQIYAHRAAMMLNSGEWPIDLVDHINGDKSDNRASNLRSANKSQNGANAHFRARSKSQMKGVYYQSNTTKWRAKAADAHIGYYETKEEAHEAYREYMRRKYGDYAGAA